MIKNDKLGTMATNLARWRPCRAAASNEWIASSASRSTAPTPTSTWSAMCRKYHANDQSQKEYLSRKSGLSFQSYVFSLSFCRFYSKNSGNKQNRDASVEFYQANPACTHRLIPWIRREVIALFGCQDMAQINRHISEILKGTLPKILMCKNDAMKGRPSTG